jgi:hypothetical protein
MQFKITPDKATSESDTKGTRQSDCTPLAVHVLNQIGIVLFSLIVVPATVVKVWHLIIFVPISILIISYWVFRTNKYVAPCYLSLLLATILWITVCENIVTIDNILGTRVTPKLPLGTRLQTWADQRLNTAARNKMFRPCCNDPLSFELQPGSHYRETYDCVSCNKTYEGVADETGHVNKSRRISNNSGWVSLFAAGDSVLQGAGMPSVLELVSEQTGLGIWNLSIEGYGPRQKVNALITHALPRRPKWLLLDFYSGNDATDAILYEVCEKDRNFRCRFNIPEVRRRLLTHPVYGQILQGDLDRIQVFDRYVENSLTLATARFFVNNMKSRVMELVTPSTSRSSSTKSTGRPLGFSGLSRPAEADIEVRRERLMEWASAGMALTHEHYERLVKTMAAMESRSRIILLYNPSAYEVYRDIDFARNKEYDAVSALQMDTLRTFAKKHGWIFVDLADPLAAKIKETQSWIYGRHDGTHWSEEGTSIVAPVLAKELTKIIESIGSDKAL